MRVVIRSRPFGQIMARLALAAMLLLVLAPTISRTLQASAGPAGTVMRLVELCTAEGMQTRLMPPTPLAGAGHDTGQPTQPDPHGGGDACGYCSLTAPLLVKLALVCGLLLLLPLAPPFRQHTFRPHLLRNLRGLGAQAPPRLL